MFQFHNSVFEENVDGEFTLTQPDLSSRLRYLNLMLNQFWRLW